MTSGRAVGAAMVFAGGLLLATGVAGAETVVGEQCAASCTERSPEILPAVDTRTQGPSPSGDVGSNTKTAPGGGSLPANESRTGAPAGALAENRESSAPSGGLPVTGGDILGLTLVGAGAIGTGVFLVRRSRSRGAPTTA